MEGVERRHRESMVFDIPPMIENVVVVVSKCVTKLRKKMALGVATTDTDSEPKQLGLVAHLGSYDQGQWSSGVSRNFWEDVVCQFLECENWTDVVDTQWQPSHEYEYVLQNGVTVRSSCVFDAESQAITMQHAEEKCIPTEHIHIPASTSHDVRLHMCEWKPISDDTLPQTVRPKCVSLQQKISFTFRHWTFDALRTWSGATRSEAERMQQVGKCKYEIRVCSVGESLKTYMDTKSDLYIATSFLMKICALFENVGRLDLFVH